MADHIPAWRTRILALRGVIRLAPVSQPKRPKRKVADPTAAGPRPLPASGRKPQSDESRWRIGARRLGTTFEAYRDHVQAIAELAPTLTAEQLATRVPACPHWTVRELLAHLAGGQRGAHCERLNFILKNEKPGGV